MGRPVFGTDRTVRLVGVLLCALASSGIVEQPGEVIGYPRPFSFREINSKNLVLQ